MTPQVTIYIYQTYNWWIYTKSKEKLLRRSDPHDSHCRNGQWVFKKTFLLQQKYIFIQQGGVRLNWNWKMEKWVLNVTVTQIQSTWILKFDVQTNNNNKKHTQNNLFPTNGGNLGIPYRAGQVSWIQKGQRFKLYDSNPIIYNYKKSLYKIKRKIIDIGSTQITTTHTKKGVYNKFLHKCNYMVWVNKTKK